MCLDCHEVFEFLGYGHDEYEARSATADRAHGILYDPDLDARRARVEAGDRTAVMEEAFLQKWLGTSGMSWYAVTEGSDGFRPYVEAMERAAAAGVGDAMVDLGVYGPESQRLDWLERAAAHGKVSGMRRLARQVHATDPDRAGELLLDAAGRTCASARFELGVVALEAKRSGRPLVVRGEVLADPVVLEHLRGAVDDGNAHAPALLAHWLVVVEGLDDDAEVARLTRLAEERGSTYVP